MLPEEKLSKFDPSNVDNAQQLAYAALELAEIAEVLSEIHGRSHLELHMRARRVARALHLDWHKGVTPLETREQIISRVLRDSSYEQKNSTTQD